VCRAPNELLEMCHRPISQNNFRVTGSAWHHVLLQHSLARACVQVQWPSSESVNDTISTITSGQLDYSLIDKLEVNVYSCRPNAQTRMADG
jgi:hypothetical protein